MFYFKPPVFSYSEVGTYDTVNKDIFKKILVLQELPSTYINPLLYRIKDTLKAFDVFKNKQKSV